MFPANYYPQSYYPPSYWPKTGGLVVGHGRGVGAGYGYLISQMIHQQMARTLMRGQTLRRVQERLVLATALRQAEYSAVEIYNQKAVAEATYTILMTEL